MKLALIPPLSLLGTAKESDYHLVLPHLYADENVYADFYKHIRQQPDQLIILDNGIAEGFDVGWDDYMEYAVDLKPDEIVLPDVIGDRKETEHESARFMKMFGAQLFGMKIKPMFVIQGQTFEECCRSIQWAFAHHFVRFGIPRHLLQTTQDLMIRFRLVEWIESYMEPDVQIHFLGASPLWCRELQVAGHFLQGKVRGMDTSMPYVYGMAGEYVSEGGTCTRPDGYFEREALTLGVESIIDENVHTMLGWTRGVA